MNQRDAIAIVQAFHDHLNNREVAMLLELASDDLRIGGPRGSGEGKYLLEEWVGRATISLVPQRWFRDDNTVVVEQKAVWRDPSTGAETGTQTVATVFTVRNGLLAGIYRYGFLGEAVNSVDMDESHEVEAPL